MNLFILRHGMAVERGDPAFPDDAQRPLTAKGRRQLRKITAAMRALEVQFDVVLSSPLIRARQTAEIVAAELKLKKRPACTEALKPGGDARKLVNQIAALRPSPKAILLVGHEPDLGELISLFVTGHPGAGLVLKKGGLAKLETKKLRTGYCATLAWLLTPKQMKLMG
jgi:phosphohistidine phosphatase